MTSYDVTGLPNPYVGLASFTYENRRQYAGREWEVRDAVTLLASPGEERVLLFVTGASGSGKSSFAEAGLVPALEERYRHLHRTVRHAVFRPSLFPLQNLARALASLGLPDAAIGGNSSLAWHSAAAFNEWLSTHTPPDQINLVVLDQFE